MNKTLNIKLLLAHLWSKISRLRRKQFGILLVLMIFSSIAEVISIGASLPFLGALTSPEYLFVHPSMQPLIKLLELTEPKQLILPLTIVFIIMALIAGATRLLTMWFSVRLAFATGADLSLNIYMLTLYQPYEIHCKRNSSELVNGISTQANAVIYSTILPILNIATSSIMLIAVMTALFLIAPVISLATFIGFAAIYFFIILFTRKQVAIDSKKVARNSALVIKSIQEGLGGIRDVLIDGSQQVYCKIYRDADLSLRRSQGNITFISQSPRYAMEALGMGLIATLAFALANQDDGLAKVIPIVGALALGAQRLLPMLQLVYGSWTSVRGNQWALQNILDLLDQPLPDHVGKSQTKPIIFQREITINNLYFRYNSEKPWVIENLNLTIPKGSRIGFIGTTGSGKSTLLDLVMGLLQPTQGGLEIDGVPVTLKNQRSWQAHIAHVPQAIFLADSTIEENIAFGIPKEEIDSEKVKRVARQAEISDVIESLEYQYQTVVGERGIRLSGGQRQRIGIARALYKEADVIIFDEATSALDSETELSVMKSIEGLSANLTILIIAHRLSTLKNCTQIIDLSRGGGCSVLGYQDILDAAKR